MRGWRHWRGGLPGAALAVLLAALPAAAVELAETLREAVESSPAMAEARASLRAAEERRLQAEYALLPVVGLSLQGDGRYSSDGVGGGPGESDGNTALSSRLAVELNKSLYDSGRSDEAEAVAAAEVEAARRRLASAEQGVLLAAAEAHIGILRARELLELARSNRDLLREQLAAARRRLELGTGTRTDVAQAATRLAAAESNVVRGQGNVEVALSRYADAVGRRPGSDPESPVGLPALPGSEAQARDQMLRDHPDLLAAIAAEQAARSSLRRVERATGATVSVFGSVSALLDGARESGDQDRQDAAVGLRLTKTLFADLVADSAIREAGEQVASRQAAVAAAQRGVETGLRAAWENFAVAQALIEAGETRVEAAELAFAGVREKAELGAGTVLEVLDAEQEALDARTALVGARYDEQLAAYRLRAAVGSLRLEELTP